MGPWSVTAGSVYVKPDRNLCLAYCDRMVFVHTIVIRQILPPSEIVVIHDVRV